MRGFNRAEGDAILAAEKAAWGPTDWVERPGSVRAEWEMYCEGMRDDFEISLRYVLSSGRLERPTVNLLLNDECLIRLDVNGKHRSSVGTHWQGYRTDEPEWVEWAPDVLAGFPASPPIKGHFYRQVLVAHAKRANINVDGIDWIDPPHGGVL